MCEDDDGGGECMIEDDDGGGERMILKLHYRPGSEGDDFNNSDEEIPELY